MVSGWKGQASFDIQDLVAVVVLVGAAVVVLEAVLVLGLVRALVPAVRDQVAVIVRLGATVVVLEAVLVLGLGGALVLVVHDPVAVRVLVIWRPAQARQEPELGAADGLDQAEAHAGVGGEAVPDVDARAQQQLQGAGVEIIAGGAGALGLARDRVLGAAGLGGEGRLARELAQQGDPLVHVHAGADAVEQPVGDLRGAEQGVLPDQHAQVEREEERLVVEAAREAGTEGHVGVAAKVVAVAGGEGQDGGEGQGEAPELLEEHRLELQPEVAEAGGGEAARLLGVVVEVVAAQDDVDRQLQAHLGLEPLVPQTQEAGEVARELALHQGQ